MNAREGERSFDDGFQNISSPQYQLSFGANKGSFIKWPKVMGYMFFWQWRSRYVVYKC